MSELPLISVCIPVYDSAVFTLVNSLFEQAKDYENKIEIVVIDDCSNSDWKLKNEEIKNLCHFIELPQNVGRSKIRNLFLNYTRGENLLFIDGDSEINSKSYLANYLEYVQKHAPEVLVGGSVYQNSKPKRSQFLRWKYSIQRESKAAEIRKTNKLGFKTNNFLIRKSVFWEIPFNENLIGYGHEDTLFGIQLSRKKIKIQHLENPVLNKHLDTNEVFLKKTENAISNLVQIYLMIDQFPEIKELKLIHFYEKMVQQKLSSIVFLIYRISRPLLLISLVNGHFTLWMFDFYKLGLFIRKIKS